jgi:hypothetical protein
MPPLKLTTGAQAGEVAGEATEAAGEAAEAVGEAMEAAGEVMAGDGDTDGDEPLRLVPLTGPSA